MLLQRWANYPDLILHHGICWKLYFTGQNIIFSPVVEITDTDTNSAPGVNKGHSSGW